MIPGVLTVLAQIAFPLVHGSARQELSAAIVLLLFCSALATCPSRGRLVGVVVPVAYVVEVIGVRTGFPFGSYAYVGHLGPRLLSVPLVVPLAWVAIAWCSLCVARRVRQRAGRRSALWVPVVGAVAMTGWDVFLDPQMVQAGGWRWTSGSPALQGIPLSNYAAWLVLSLLLLVVLDRVLAPTSSVAPVALWVWTWLGSTLAFLVFLDLPVDGLIGFAAMGLVGVPLLLSSRRRTTSAPPRTLALADDTAGEGLCVTADR